MAKIKEHLYVPKKASKPLGPVVGFIAVGWERFDREKKDPPTSGWGMSAESAVKDLENNSVELVQESVRIIELK